MSLYEKYYNILGLGDSVLLKEVKKDYQKLANKYPPDKSGVRKKWWILILLINTEKSKNKFIEVF